MKLFDSELKVMEVLWEQGALSAGSLEKILKEEVGWNRNTTYTVIKKLVGKGAIERQEPHFICLPLVTREKVQEEETTELINKMYKGSMSMFFSSFLNEKNLKKDDISALREIVEQLKE